MSPHTGSLVRHYSFADLGGLTGCYPVEQFELGHDATNRTLAQKRASVVNDSSPPQYSGLLTTPSVFSTSFLSSAEGFNRATELAKENSLPNLPSLSQVPFGVTGSM